jgi:hypothetical protein
MPTYFKNTKPEVDISPIVVTSPIPFTIEPIEMIILSIVSEGKTIQLKWNSFIGIQWF